MNDSIRDIRPPVDLPHSWLPWFLFGVLILLLVFVGWLIYQGIRKPKKKQEQSPQVTIPSWQKAYTRLENLKSKQLIERASLKPYYDELSLILRQYIEERFNLRAPEMTTEEFLDSIKRSSVLDSAQQQIIKEFLFICDMVKFAKHDSSVSEAQKCFDLAKQFIDLTHGI